MLVLLPVASCFWQNVNKNIKIVRRRYGTPFLQKQEHKRNKKMWSNDDNDDDNNDDDNNDDDNQKESREEGGPHEDREQGGAKEIRLFGREAEYSALLNAYQEVCMVTTPPTLVGTPLNNKNNCSNSVYHSRNSRNNNSSRRFVGNVQGTVHDDVDRENNNSVDDDDDGDDKKVRLVLISGPPGCGKTYLAESLRFQVQNADGFFLTWKCDQSKHLRVGGGMQGCFNGFVKDILLTRDASTIQQVRDRIVSTLSTPTKLGLLMDMIPQLKDLLLSTNHHDNNNNNNSNHNHANSNHQNDENNDNNDNASSSFIALAQDVTMNDFDTSGLNNFAVSGLYRALGSDPERPLVQLLDDFHWGDANALHWMPLLIRKSSPNANALFVATCDEIMDDDNDEDTAWGMARRILEESVHVTHIRLGNLTPQAIHEMVVDAKLPLLHHHPIDDDSDNDNNGVDSNDDDESNDDNKTEEIARFIVSKTNGNPMFAQELLLELLRDMALHPNSDNDDDNNNIPFERLSRYESVYDVMEHRYATLDKDARDTILLASCFGYSFSNENLCIAKATTVDQDLDTLVRRGIVVHEGNNEFRFANNALQATAYALIGSEQDRARRHFVVGKRLLRAKRQDGSLESNMLTVTGQLILGASAMEEREDRYGASRLCLEAARRCVFFTSFQGASTCLETALALLYRNGERSAWRDEYELTLALHNATAEVAYVLGNHDNKVQRMLAAVSSHARSLYDTLQANSVHLYVLGTQKHSDEGTKAGLPLLEQLGERFPKKITGRTIASEFVRTRLALRGKSDGQLLRLPSMSDQRVLSAMQVMNIIFSGVLRNRPRLAPLVCMRMVRLSVSHGLCAPSSYGFALYGLLVCSYGRNANEGCRYGELALKLLHRFTTKEFIARVYFLVHGIVRLFQQPMQLSLMDLKRGFRVGLESGDIEVRKPTTTVAKIFFA